MTELKPCPFCGEESNIYLGDSTDGYIRGTQYVEAYCNKCGARIKRHLVSEAIEAWNARSNPSHNGKPTEEGWYLIKVAVDGSYITNYWENGHWRHPLYYNYCVWQKIED